MMFEIPPPWFSATIAQVIVTDMMITICIKSDAITAHDPPVTDITNTTIPVAQIVVSISTPKIPEAMIARPFSQIPALITLFGIPVQVNTCSFLLPKRWRTA